MGIALLSSTSQVMLRMSAACLLTQLLILTMSNRLLGRRKEVQDISLPVLLFEMHLILRSDIKSCSIRFSGTGI
jgi:ABC-type uncharacterized transport system YnjBCD permease subunit